MILFLAVTAMINIALGYGLALYLGHARLQALHFRPQEIPALESVGLGNFDALPEAAAADPAPVAALSEDVELPGAPVEAVELEQDVLAGIEEFRNQLAQMKGEPIAQPELASAR